jgi:hypothetical protein
VQEASDQQKILLLLFILGQENLNSIYPHETAKSRKVYIYCDNYSHGIAFSPINAGQGSTPA